MKYVSRLAYKNMDIFFSTVLLSSACAVFSTKIDTFNLKGKDQDIFEQFLEHYTQGNRTKISTKPTRSVELDCMGILKGRWQIALESWSNCESTFEALMLLILIIYYCS